MKTHLHRLGLIALITLLPARSAMAADDDNAADLYREAIKQTPVSPEDLETYKADKPSPDAGKAVLEKGAKALSLLHDATAMSKTDWKIDTDNKTDSMFAFLSNARWLSELSYLKVEADLSAGKRKEAAEAITDRLMLGRRLQKIRMGVPLLAGQALEESALSQASANLPDLGEEAISTVAKAWGRARPLAGVEDVLQAEHLEANSPGAEKLRSSAGRMEVLRAMFTAALNAPKGGADQFASTKDPEGGKPFGYKELPHGYQLTSALQYKGKPVTLTVGKSDETR